jgi:hypothetical protein
LVGWIPKGALSITSREKGIGWTLDRCKSPQVQKYFLRNSHQNSHSRTKKKTAFGGGL